MALHNRPTRNVKTPELEATGEYRVARVAEQAGAENLGVIVYELSPGESMVFHYHVQREELMIVLRGTVALRTAEIVEPAPGPRSRLPKRS